MGGRPERAERADGDEGRGKTWSALAWANTRPADSAELVLFVSAREVVERDAESLIARLLHARTGVRDESFWRRRLELWGRAAWTQPKLVLIIDGLNQHWLRTDWADLLQPLFDPDAWGDLCRPLVILPLPIEAPDHSALADARAQLVDRANTDGRLFDLARQAQRSGRSAWLSGVVREDLALTEPFHFARAY